MHAFFSEYIQLYMNCTLGVIVDIISSAPLEWNCDPMPYKKNICIFVWTKFNETHISDVSISGRKIKNELRIRWIDNNIH
jgi:hypothetical protein